MKRIGPPMMSLSAMKSYKVGWKLSCETRPIVEGADQFVEKSGKTGARGDEYACHLVIRCLYGSRHVRVTQ